MGMTRLGHESLNSPCRFFPKLMRVSPVKLYTESFDRFLFQNLMTHIFQNEYFSALQYISPHRPPKYNEQLNLSLSDLQLTECNGTKRVWGTYPVHGFILTTQYHKCSMYCICCQNILGTHPVPQECVGPFEESSAPASLPHHTNLEMSFFISLLNSSSGSKLCRQFNFNLRVDCQLFSLLVLHLLRVVVVTECSVVKGHTVVCLGHHLQQWVIKTIDLKPKPPKRWQSGQKWAPLARQQKCLAGQTCSPAGGTR